MRSFEIKIVARAVQVRRQQKYRIKAVLLTIGLRLDQHHLLREAIRCVGFLRITVPQILFLKRHRRKLWIRAYRSGGHKFLHALQTRLLDELRTHHQILVKKPAGVFLVVTDAADNRGQVNHQIRLSLVEQPDDVAFFDQIILMAPGNKDLGVTRPQLVDYEAPEETCPTRNNDTVVRKLSVQLRASSTDCLV